MLANINQDDMKKVFHLTAKKANNDTLKNTYLNFNYAIININIFTCENTTEGRKD